MRIRPDESEDKLCEVFRVVARVQLRVANARKGNFLSGPYRAIRELRRVGHSCTPLRCDSDRDEERCVRVGAASVRKFFCTWV